MMNEKVLEEAREIIAGFLKNRRLELGISQYELAAKTGLARKTIIAMEQAKFWPGMKQYLIICEALHLFPCAVEIEADTEIASALRELWKPHDKAMSITDALELKNRRHRRDAEDN